MSTKHVEEKAETLSAEELKRVTKKARITGLITGLIAASVFVFLGLDDPFGFSLLFPIAAFCLFTLIGYGNVMARHNANGWEFDDTASSSSIDDPRFTRSTDYATSPTYSHMPGNVHYHR